MDQNFLLKKAAEMRWNMMSKPSGLSGSRSRFLCSESPDVGRRSNFSRISGGSNSSNLQVSSLKGVMA